MSELKNVEELKGVYIPTYEDNFAFARDIWRRMSNIKIKVDKSIPGMINLYNYDNPMIQIMGFDKSDTWEDTSGGIFIHAFDALFELHPNEDDDSYVLTGVYRKYDFEAN